MSKMTEDLYKRLDVANKAEQGEVDFHVEAHTLVMKMVDLHEEIAKTQQQIEMTFTAHQAHLDRSHTMGRHLIALQEELNKLIAERARLTK